MKYFMKMLSAGIFAIIMLLTLASSALATAPTQTVDCSKIVANYHRSLVNGDHINTTLSPHGQVNMYVDLNIAGGWNTYGLRWQILGQQQTPIPLTQAQVQSGIITFNYAASLPSSVTNWTVSFVQTNETDTWPNTNCSGGPINPPEEPEDPPTNPDLEVTKTSSDSSINRNGILDFTIKVKNTGNTTLNNVVACDKPGKGVKVLSASPAASYTSNKKLCWAFSTLTASSSKTITVNAKIPSYVTKTINLGNSDNQIDVQKQEEHISLMPGQTKTVTVACNNNYFVTDGSVRVDHVDQDTGTLDDVKISESYAVNDNSYKFTVTNHALGQAQAKGFVTCIKKTTSQGNHLSSKPAVGSNVNGHNPVGSAKCSSGLLTSPGFKVNNGELAIYKSNQNGNTRSLGFYGTGDVNISARCLKLDNGSLNMHHIEKTVTLPGNYDSRVSGPIKLTCGQLEKGIVATFDLPFVKFYGHEPQPVSRLFWVVNPYNHSKTVKVDLECINVRTHKVKKHYAKKVKNVAVAWADGVNKDHSAVTVKVN